MNDQVAYVMNGLRQRRSDARDAARRGWNGSWHRDSATTAASKPSFAPSTPPEQAAWVPSWRYSQQLPTPNPYALMRDMTDEEIMAVLMPQMRGA